MEINSEFELPLAPDAAYELLLDLERVAPCMPGAVLGAERDDGARELSVAVRLGPMKFNYSGTVRIADQDESARRATLVGQAQEKRGQGSAKATITTTVSEAGAGTSKVDSLAVFELTGRAAQTGRGIVEDVARRMVGEMSKCLAAKFSAEGGGGGTSAAGAPGGSIPAPGGSTRAPGRSSAPPAAGSVPPPPGGSSPGATIRPVAASTPAAPPIKAGSLMMSILWDRIRRLWSRLTQRGRPAR